jgi:twitching motility protein PilJ
LWQRLSLRAKATTLSITLSTLPIIAIGATAYYLTNQNITENVTRQQQARVISLANDLNRFISEGHRDIQTLSRLGILNNPQLRTITSTKQKQAVLDQYIKYNAGYDSIVVTDIAGNVILQSAGEVISNYSEIDYFQEVLKTNRPVITPPRKSSLTGEYSIFFAAPSCRYKDKVKHSV